MNLNTLTLNNPAVPAPIVMGTAEKPMPVSFSGRDKSPRLKAARLFIAHNIGRLKFAGRKT